MTEDRIIVALDLADPREIDVLCAALAGKVRMLKVGLQLFLSQGPSIVGEIRRAGFDVFLDLKLHDIPNTVAGAVAAASDLGVDLLTVHGGAQFRPNTHLAMLVAGVLIWVRYGAAVSVTG